MTGDAQEVEKQKPGPEQAAGAVPDPHEEPEQTMESLLQEQDALHGKLQSREVVWVKVIQVSSEHVLVDIGEKSEGIIPLYEFPKDNRPAVGRRIPAVLVKRGRSEQPAVLSTERAKWRLGWDQGCCNWVSEKYPCPGHPGARRYQLLRVHPGPCHAS